MKQLRRLCIFLCMLFFLCNTSNVVAARAPQSNTGNASQSDSPVVLVNDRVVVTIQYGFEQMARYGRNLQLTAKIYNKGESFSGEVAVTLINEEQEDIRYATTATILGLEKNVITLNLPLNRMTRELSFEISTADGDTIIEDILPLNATNLGSYYMIGILSNVTTPLSYFEHFGNKTTFLDQSNFPSDINGLDMIDALVIDEFSVATLNEAQQDTMIQYVKQGGTIVLGSEAYYKDDMLAIEWLERLGILTLQQESQHSGVVETAKIAMDDSLEFSDLMLKVKSYENARTSALKYKEEVRNNTPEREANLYIGKPMLGNQLISDLKLTKEDKAVRIFSIQNADKSLESEQLTIYEKVSYGDGNILVYHFPLSMEEVKESELLVNGGVNGKLLNTFYVGVVAQVLEDIPEVVKKKVIGEEYANYSQYRVESILENADYMEVPKVFPYTMILIVYIAIIGPVLYFVLKKKKKSILVWIIVPCLSIIFTGLIYFMGESTRITEPYLSYFNVEVYDPETKRLEGETDLKVYLTSNQDTKLTVGNANQIIAGNYEFPTYYDEVEKESSYSNATYTDTISTSITKGNEDYSLEFSHIPAFTGQNFSLSYSREFIEEITGQVNLTEDNMTGQVTNDSVLNFEEAYVYCNGRIALLGTLEGGDSVSLEECSQEYSTNIDSVLFYSDTISHELGNKETRVAPDRIRKNNALSMLVEEGLYRKEGAYLIGFSAELPVEHPFATIAMNRISYGVSMMVVPLELNTATKGEVFVPNLDRYLTSSANTYYDSVYRFVYTSSLELEYQFPKEEELTKLVLADVFTTSPTQTSSYNLMAKKISFYNRRTNQYDLVFRSDLLQDGKYQKVLHGEEDGETSLSDVELSDYLSENKELKVKYEGDDVEMSGVFSIPMISYIKKG